MSTLLNTTTDSASARFVKAIGDPATAGFQLFRRWEKVNATYQDGLTVALNAIKSYTDPKADAQKYTGKFIVSRIVPEVDSEDAVNIEQQLTKVTTVSSVTNLTNPLIDRRKNIINPFGEGRGTSWAIVHRYLNLDPASDTKCIVLSDTSLEAKMGAGYDLIDRKTSIEDNRTMTFWLLSEKKARIDWADTVRVNPDHIDRQNPGRDDEVMIRSWFGIDNADDATVRAALQSATNIPAGYALLGYKQSDVQEGADDWTQTLVRTHNDTNTDSEIVATHSVEHTAMQRKHFNYNNYSTEPADPSVGTGFRFVRAEVGLNGDGLIQKVVIHEKPDPSNNLTNRKPARNKIDEETNPETDSLAGNYFEQLYDRVHVSSADSAIQRLKTSDTSTDCFVVTSVNYQDIGDGSARIRRRKKVVNKKARFFVRQLNTDIGYGQRTAIREWPDVKDTKAVVLMTDSSLDSFAVKRGTDSKWYVGNTRTRQRHGDGTSTVVQMGIIPKSGFTDRNLADTAIGTAAGASNDSNLHSDYVMIPSNKHMNRRAYRKYFGSFSNARKWVDSGVNVAGNDRDRPFGNNEGKVRQISTGRYEAIKVRYYLPSGTT